MDAPEWKTFIQQTLPQRLSSVFIAQFVYSLARATQHWSESIQFILKA